MIKLMRIAAQSIASLAVLLRAHVVQQSINSNLKIRESRRVIGSLVILGVAAGCSEQSPDNTRTEEDLARPAKIVNVLVSDVRMKRTFPGTLEAASQVELAFRVGGQLSQLPVKAGDRVQKGDLLARLDEADYRNALEERQARFDLAKIQYEQASKLLPQKLISQLQYDQAVAELKSARSALEQARDNFQYTRLAAPFDGIVARVMIENFQAVQAKAPVIQLQSDQNMEVRFSIPESLISQLKQVNDPSQLDVFCGTATFSSHPEKPYKVCHKEHEWIPDALTRNYTAIFSLEKITEFAVLPGMSIDVELDFSAYMTDEVINSLFVPVEAVFEEQNQKWVWVIGQDMRTHKVSIEVGRLTGNNMEITEGLNAGQSIVAAGVSYIREGMLVKPLVKERGL